MDVNSVGGGGGGDFPKFYFLNHGSLYFSQLKQKQISKYVLCISRTRLFAKKKSRCNRRAIMF